jgi:hypothetical protein
MAKLSRFHGLNISLRRVLRSARTRIARTAWNFAGSLTKCGSTTFAGLHARPNDRPAVNLKLAHSKTFPQAFASPL